MANPEHLHILKHGVAYPVAAENVSGPLARLLRRVNRRVISLRNAFSPPRSSLLAGILHHVIGWNVARLIRRGGQPYRRPA